MATYKVIKGKFHVRDFSPDGDSIRFEADNHDNWNWSGFKWDNKNALKSKKKQLRIEGVDALETHYLGARQPHSFAVAALERMLELIGITNVKYNLMMTKIIEAQDGSPGFIISGSIDKFNRPVSFIFPAAATLTDGAELNENQVPLDISLNYQLAAEGIVYPTFYTSMEPVIIEKLKEAFVAAKNKRQGLWAIDRTAGFRMWNTETVQKDIIILPKLFRRIISYFDNYGDMASFKEFLKKNSDPIVVNGKNDHFYKHITVTENFVGLNLSPEEILFKPTS